MATITVAKLISDWELLHTALQPHLTDLPFLKDQATELEGLIADAKGMDTKQQDLRGSLQETVRQRKDLEKRGTVLRSQRSCGAPSASTTRRSSAPGSSRAGPARRRGRLTLRRRSRPPRSRRPVSRVL
jgi:hypothetical protein